MKRDFRRENHVSKEVGRKQPDIGIILIEKDAWVGGLGMGSDNNKIWDVMTISPAGGQRSSLRSQEPSVLLVTSLPITWPGLNLVHCSYFGLFALT